MKNARKLLMPITTFVPIDIKRLFRDKVAIFFTFVFPLIFLLIFGSIFSGDNNVSFRIALFNQSDSEIATAFEQQLKENDFFQIDEEVTTQELANERMSRGQLDATVTLPPNFGVVGEGQSTPSGNIEVSYNQTNENAGQTLSSVLSAIMNDLNNQFVDTSVPFTVTASSTDVVGLSQFDYTFSGILGFTLLSLGVFGPTTVFPRLKQKGVLRRFKATPLRVWQFFVSNVLSNAFVGLLALVFMFVAAVIVFDLNMRGSYVNLAIVVVLGTILLFGIGLAIGGWAKNENQAAPIAQLVTLPMMFLSGVFFPVFLMPEFLQNITRFIPLTPIIDSIRLVITENASLLDLAPEISIMLAWTVAIYLVAFKLFSWE